MCICIPAVPIRSIYIPPAVDYTVFLYSCISSCSSAFQCLLTPLSRSFNPTINTIFRELQSNYQRNAQEQELIRKCRNIVQCQTVGRQTDSAEHGARYVQYSNGCTYIFLGSSDMLDSTSKQATVASFHTLASQYFINHRTVRRSRCYSHKLLTASVNKQ